MKVYIESSIAREGDDTIQPGWHDLPAELAESLIKNEMALDEAGYKAIERGIEKADKIQAKSESDLQKSIRKEEEKRKKDEAAAIAAAIKAQEKATEAQKGAVTTTKTARAAVK